MDKKMITQLQSAAEVLLQSMIKDLLITGIFKIYYFPIMERLIVVYENSISFAQIEQLDNAVKGHCGKNIKYRLIGLESL
jgi:hypothetical protein